MKYCCYISFLLLSMFAGCTKTEPTKSLIPVKFINTKQIEYSIEKVIPTEMTNDGLIGENFNFKALSEHYIFGDNGKIMIFSKQGKFEAVINAIGNGPNEVTSFNLFSADNTSISVMSPGKKKILEFDFAGKFIQEHNLQNNYFAFTRFNDFYLFDNQSYATENGNVLLIVDKTGNAVKDTISVIAEGIGYGKDKFQVFDDYTLFLPTMSNVIYRIDKTLNITDAYTLNFGSYWLNADRSNAVAKKSNGDPFALWEYLKRNDKIGFLRFLDTPNWLFLNFEKQDKQYNWYYNKLDNRQYMIDITDNSVNNSILASDVVGVDNNGFIAVIPAYRYAQLSNVPQLNLSSEDNPVIVVFTIKNDSN